MLFNNYEEEKIIIIMRKKRFLSFLVSSIIFSTHWAITEMVALYSYFCPLNFSHLTMYAELFPVRAIEVDQVLVQSC